MKSRSVVFFRAGLCSVALGSWSPAAAQPRDALAGWLHDCTIASEPARCGTYPVFENRGADAGRKIGIHVVVLPAFSATPAPDPVFYFQGGPGGAASEAVGDIALLLEEVRFERDLVFVDQRGTGSSNPLDCDEAGDDDLLQAYFLEFASQEYVRRCLARQHADVRLYTTPIAMDDVDEIRRALGYERINILGGSYGTRAALIYLRRYSEHVRSAVLKGVEPTNTKNPLPFARAAERALEAVFENCEADPECRDAFPELRDDWRHALARFEKGPVDAEVSHPPTERREKVRISRGVFADGIRHLLYSVNRSRSLPQIVHAAARGDFRPFAEMTLRQAMDFSGALSFGMFLTVTCAEDIQFIGEEEIGPATDGTFLGDYRIRRQQAACREWPLGPVGADYLDPVRADTPVLLMSGAVDPATPPEGAEEVGRYLPNSLHVVFPNQSHGFANPVCSMKLFFDFFSKGSADGLDVSCAGETRRPAFTTEVN